jgi:peptidoglycan/xylan/chitin deacetylase (PgdA/CDA1 family)
MNGPRLLKRLLEHCQWNMVKHLARRDVRMKNRFPIISFTFDDFPHSALRVGGGILKAQGFAGTYYASLGLLDQDSPVGRICSAADLEEVLTQGHELGCHTFAHCNAWSTAPMAFEASILENRRALARLLPAASFTTLSYPLAMPRLRTKTRAGRYFACCRGGGQTFNRGTLDLNHVQAFFLEQSRDRADAIREVIDQNSAAGGWLVLATHDIAERPTRFGCGPAFFEEVVRWARDSGARVLPVSRALEEVSGS